MTALDEELLQETLIKVAPPNFKETFFFFFRKAISKFVRNSNAMIIMPRAICAFCKLHMYLLHV